MASFHEAFTPFALSVARHGSVATVMLRGELDLATAPALSAAVGEHSEADLLILDLTELTFIDSTGIRTLIEANGRGSGPDSRLMVVVGAGPVRRTLDLCKLDTRLVIVGDRPAQAGNGAVGRS